MNDTFMYHYNYSGEEEPVYLFNNILLFFIIGICCFISVCSRFSISNSIQNSNLTPEHTANQIQEASMGEIEEDSTSDTPWEDIYLNVNVNEEDKQIKKNTSYDYEPKASNSIACKKDLIIENPPSYDTVSIY
tara:strand:+ start:963 stop:1361 length:399 start_codon:yes stop_codon:yes gene_type:complete